MSSNVIGGKTKIIITMIIFVLSFIYNCGFVNAETAKLNHENFNISFKNISSDDKVSIELGNYPENFTDIYHIIKVTFKNVEIIEAYEEDNGEYDNYNGTKHINNIIDKTSLARNNEIMLLKIDDLSPNEIALPVNVDFLVTVYRNDEKVIDRKNMGFDENLFETDGYNRYYYSNFTIDLADNSITDSTDGSIVNYTIIITLIVLLVGIIIAIIAIIVTNSKKRFNSWQSK